MKVLKDTWKNPIVKKLIIGTGVFLLILIFLMMFASCTNKGKKYSYTEIEKIMVSKVKTKYANSSELPSKGSKLEVNINKLVEEGLMKSINEYTKDEEANCSGKVTIYNNNGSYLYVPNIDCGEKYKTKNLHDTIISDNLVTSGNGLYQINDEYVFKGDNISNYISIENELFRIISINEDGTIRLVENKGKAENFTVWDDRYNVDKGANYGINNYYENGLSSRLRDKLDSIYKSNIYSDELKAYFIPREHCVGKRSVNESDNSGSIECSVKSEATPISTIALYEYFRASLDPNCNAVLSESCTNYNYFNSSSYNNMLTLTADKDSSYKVFKIMSGAVMLSNASNSSTLKIVVNVSGDLSVVSGDGTSENPYMINNAK